MTGAGEHGATPSFAQIAEPAPGLLLYRATVGWLETNAYLLESAGELLLVDAADQALFLEEEISKRGTLTCIVETHNHPDHTAALKELSQKFKVPVLAHRADPLPVPALAVADGELVRLGGHACNILHTPGHTAGSICLDVSGTLLTGDTLFPGGPGHTDRDPVRFSAIMESVERLMTYPDSTTFYPGHGSGSTIGKERPGVPAWKARGW